MNVKQRIVSSILNIFFLIVFAISCVIYGLNGDVASSLGFLLLALSNVPTLLIAWSDIVVTPRMTMGGNVLAVVGLLFVMMGWLGLF